MATNADRAGPLFALPCHRRRRHRTSPVPDGSLLLRSAEPLGAYPATVVHSRGGPGPRRARSTCWSPSGNPAGRGGAAGYGEAVAAADAIGQALLDRGLGPGRPLLLLSGNGVDHLLLTLGAMTAGVPVAPVSVAYSLQSHDHARIRAIAELIRPGAVFAEDAGRFGPAAGRAGRGARHRKPG